MYSVFVNASLPRLCVLRRANTTSHLASGKDEEIENFLGKKIPSRFFFFNFGSGPRLKIPRLIDGGFSLSFAPLRVSLSLFLYYILINIDDAGGKRFGRERRDSEVHGFLPLSTSASASASSSSSSIRILWGADTHCDECVKSRVSRHLSPVDYSTAAALAGRRKFVIQIKLKLI